MAQDPEEREVTHTAKDDNKVITALCNPDEWGTVSKAEAIRQIDAEEFSYYVQWGWAKRTEISVVDGPDGKYLRTDRDSTPKNNLEDLPDC